jgi:glycosyltransferase involved in cell wall biosynthesis
MRISVVIPTYNSGPLLEEAVESVLAQTVPAAEVIVVDDGSLDDTAARMQRYRDRVEYIRQPNRRVAAARNTGLARATGDLVAFLDADDVWHPEKLARQVAVLNDHPTVGLLATWAKAWPGTFSALDQRPIILECVPLVRLLVFNPLVTSSIIVRREVLEQAGRFDTELFGPEDYDLWLRCARVSGCAILREALTGYRDTGGSVGKQAETMRAGLLQIHQKLDAQNAWPGRWFRRKCRAHIDYSTGFMYLASGQPEQAARLLARSLAMYPFPMSPAEIRYRFGRVRLLARAAWVGWQDWLYGSATRGARSHSFGQSRQA